MRLLTFMLVLFIGAALPAVAANQVGDLSGTYRTVGTNPGSETQYEGTTELVRSGTGYDLVQRVAADTFRGRGEVQGGNLVVRFDNGIMATYAIRPDGSLEGVWSGPDNRETGRATGRETLIPMRR